MAIISKGNNKMGNIPNVSLPPIVTCNGCASTCGKKCYANKFYRMWPTVKKAWDANLAEYKNDYDGYFSSILHGLKKMKKPTKFFRWHVSGDIVAYNYLGGMVHIALRCPETKFLVFTKQFALVNNYLQRNKNQLPENLQVVFSAWPGMEMENPYGFRVAWMQDGTETRVPDNAFHCPGDCMSCTACFCLDEIGKDVCFEIH